MNPNQSEAVITPFVISHEFNAPRELVWKAWTERDQLMQWFGPKDFVISVATMDFRPGGSFHYCLTGPNGKEMWGKFVYRQIVPPEKIELVNSFSDRRADITRHPLSADWPLEMLSKMTMVEANDKTMLTLEWNPLNPGDPELKKFDSARDEMKQGWQNTFAQLADYLAKCER
jgi:uncharacterized protein YndB with AHSA1/START domain